MALPQGVGAPAASSRIAWVDLVKACSVLLVVQMHFVQMLVAAHTTAITGFWQIYIQVMEPLRMPIFFVVSGMVAASALSRDWRSNRRRTLGVGYLYVLWSVLLLGLLALVSMEPTPSLGELLTEIPAVLAFPTDGYWYLLALLAFFVLAKLTRRYPAWLVVGVAAVPALFRVATLEFVDWAAEPVHSPGMLASLPLNLVFFLIGARMRDLVAGLASKANWALVLVFGSAALWLSVAKIQSQNEWGVNALPTSLLWVATGVMAAALLIRSSGVRRFGAYLGARTLPIFVLQFPILVLAREFLAITGPSPLASPFVQVLFPLLTTAATVAVALAIHRLCQKPALSWLFRAPDQLLEPGSLTAPTLRKEPAVVQVPAR